LRVGSAGAEIAGAAAELGVGNRGGEQSAKGYFSHDCKSSSTKT
jgi:hypothetical protein